MELKIGEIFEFGGEWYQCVKSPDGSCKHCDMNFGGKCPIPIKECVASSRSDLSYVIFKKLEKVGEPIEFARGLYFQRYRLAYSTAFYEGDTRLFFNAPTKTFVYIEIKQNEEDMEEKGHYIGEIWGNNGWYYKCVPQEDEKMRCQGCVFVECGSEHCEEWHGGCSKEKRTDGKNVIFKRLKEVWKNTYWGEPKWCDKNVYETFEDAREAGRAQGDRYITSENIADEYGYVERDVKCNDKKDKDMEEKKLNLKPFDLQKAKAGKPVCTRDGRKARIICFDAKRKDEKSIIALVPSKDYPGFEDLIAYPNNGNYHGGHENDGDLMMFPEKKEGWVNVYYDNDASSHRGCRYIYDTKERAVKEAGSNYITTVKINWEE